MAPVKNGMNAKVSILSSTCTSSNSTASTGTSSSFRRSTSNTDNSPSDTPSPRIFLLPVQSRRGSTSGSGNPGATIGSISTGSTATIRNSHTNLAVQLTSHDDVTEDGRTATNNNWNTSISIASTGNASVASHLLDDKMKHPPSNLMSDNRGHHPSLFQHHSRNSNHFENGMMEEKESSRHDYDQQQHQQQMTSDFLSPPPQEQHAPYISVAGRRKRRRTTVEDAFRSLSLHPKPPSCNNEQDGILEEETKEMDTHHASWTFSQNNDRTETDCRNHQPNHQGMEMETKADGNGNGSKTLYHLPSSSGRQRQILDPVDAKLEELIRHSRLQALIQSTNEKQQQQKRQGEKKEDKSLYELLWKQQSLEKGKDCHYEEDPVDEEDQDHSMNGEGGVGDGKEGNCENMGGALRRKNGLSSSPSGQEEGEQVLVTKDDFHLISSCSISSNDSTSSIMLNGKDNGAGKTSQMVEIGSSHSSGSTIQSLHELQTKRLSTNGQLPPEPPPSSSTRGRGREAKARSSENEQDDWGLASSRRSRSIPREMKYSTNANRSNRNNSASRSNSNSWMTRPATTSHATSTTLSSSSTRTITNSNSVLDVDMQ